jgi:NhaP-type Na+/H+ or K+/H+ antiporter
MAYVGALAFGLVIGWVTYRTLRRRSGRAKITDVGMRLHSESATPMRT